MYQLKQLPEDFVVKEISNVLIKNRGKYLYFQLRKKDCNTLDVVKELASTFHLKEKQIGFAGSKDKKAVTEQKCSIVGVTKERLLGIKIPAVGIEFLGYGDVPISLGDLEGNSFEIMVRNLDQFTVDKIDYLPNYFDEQRFGTHNMEIGRHLIKKEFAEALQLINNPLCQKHLQQKPQDFIGALKSVPLRLLRLYINAYQSYLWNETLAGYLQMKGKVVKEEKYSLGSFIFVESEKKYLNLTLPLVGFNSENNLGNEEIAKIINELLKKEKIAPHDFIFRSIPELTLEGEGRVAFVPVKNLQVSSTEPDELNLGKKKIKLTFTLGKSSYATMVVRRVIS